MIPQHRLSTTPQFWYYLPPDDLDPQPHIDYELAGIGLNDPSAGMMYQVWVATLEPVPFTTNWSVFVEAPNTPKTLLFQRPNVSEISLSFDQNMNPFIAFVEAGQARFWWFDPLAGTQVFTDLAVGSRSPKASLDDKRRLQTAASDIILGYIRNDNLYFREQRDRYLIEYLLKTGVTQDLLRIGMHGRLRLQFAIGQMDSPPALNFIYRVTTSGDRRVTTQGDVRRCVGSA